MSIWNYRDVRNYIWSHTDSMTLFRSVRPVCKLWNVEAWKWLLTRKTKIEKTLPTAENFTIYSVRKMHHSLIVVKLSDSEFVPVGPYAIRNPNSRIRTEIDLETRKQKNFFGNGKRDRDDMTKAKQTITVITCPVECGGILGPRCNNHTTTWQVDGEPPHKLIKSIFAK
jgi:hypothetical protein